MKITLGSNSRNPLAWLYIFGVMVSHIYFFTTVRGQVEDKHSEKGDEEARTNHGDCIEKRKTANV